MSRAALPPLAVALALRLAVVASCDRAVGDVARYGRVARHVLDVSWNPYATERLYPYPPPWAAIEAGALWLERRGIGSFAVNVKLPPVAADLGIVALLGRAAALGLAPAAAPWLYALHPVSLLVTGAHGQFDAMPLACLLLALVLAQRARQDASALALGAGIALKSFPVLALPFLALRAGPRRAALRYAALALAPGALLLLPFAIAGPHALRRELFGYGGIADFGWAGLARGAEWLATGALPRSEARFWPAAALASRLVFLAAWAAMALAAGAGRLRLDAQRAVLLVLVAFAALYGLQSAQYLLWVVPFALLAPGAHAAAHAAAACAGLAGFYLFLAPGVLAPGELEGAPLVWAGRLWVAGAAATFLVSAAWLRRLVGDALRYDGPGP